MINKLRALVALALIGASYNLYTQQQSSETPIKTNKKGQKSLQEAFVIVGAYKTMQKSLKSPFLDKNSLESFMQPKKLVFSLEKQKFEPKALTPKIDITE